MPLRRQARNEEKGAFGPRRAGRTTLLAGGTRGYIFVAGKPDESLLDHGRSVFGILKLQMPLPDGKLPNDEIELLAQWIKKGSGVLIMAWRQKLQKKGKRDRLENGERVLAVSPLLPACAYREITVVCA